MTNIFHILLHCLVITTIKPINTFIISHSYSVLVSFFGENNSDIFSK